MCFFIHLKLNLRDLTLFFMKNVKCCGILSMFRIWKQAIHLAKLHVIRGINCKPAPKTLGFLGVIKVKAVN